MKRIIAAMATIILSLGCYAQDMIVKKDGSIIQAKVMKVGTTEVDYKKWSNQDGPSYAIAKSDILAITYQNGDKETFEDNQTTQINQGHKKSLCEYPSTLQNAELIKNINNAPFSITDNKIVAKHKKTKYVGMQLGVANNSVLHSDELSIAFEIGRVRFGNEFQTIPVGLDKTNVNYTLSTKTHILTYFSVVGYPALNINLTNNTDKIMFIDLANTFLSKGQVAEPYYVPTATTTSTTSTSGGSFNLGGITNGLGIGGIAGSLANATTIGGSHGTTSGTIEYSQRIVSIPPHSTKILPIKRIEDNSFMSEMNSMRFGHATNINYPKEIYIGDEIPFEESNSPFKLSFFTTFSYDEGLSEPITSSISLFCKKILGVDSRNGYFIYLHYLDYSTQGHYTFGHIGK